MPLGPRLHVAVVTADSGAALEWGAGYEYDLAFVEGGHTRGLRDDGVLVARYGEAELVEQLVYRAGDRPGFVVPAAEAEALRIVHGSCRKLHGAGHDALAHVDHLIELAVTRDRRPGLDASVVRPQLLCLTGDQVYADDVHTSLLRRLHVYAALDLDGREAVEIADLWPGRRAAALAAAGLTSGAMASHLVGFAEFVAMYVFAWSPVAWGLFDEIPDDLKGAHRALPRVRRALANVSSLMVFDDHEVTDDWNIRRSWFEAVMAGGLGRRVVRNGLLAYAVFQHWGNDPAAFEAGAGAALLGLLAAGWRGASGDRAAVIAVEHRLGLVADPGDLAGARAGAIDYGWCYETPAAVVVGLDCRMRRAFLGGQVDLASRAAIDERLPAGAARLTVVLSPTPVLGWRLLERVQALAGRLGLDVAFDDEAWGQSPAQAWLLARLLSRGPALVLSGDVHYGFAARLTVSGGAFAGRAVCNLVASALKNRSDGLCRLLHPLGWWRHALRGGPDAVLGEGDEAALRAELGAATVAAPWAGEGWVGEEGVVAPPPATRGVVELDGERRDRWPLCGWSQLGEVVLSPGEGWVEHVIWWADGEGRVKRQVDRVVFDFEG